MASLLRKLEVPYPENEAAPTFITNHDIKPIEKGRRVWGWSAYVGLWSTIAFNMSNFQLGSSMIALGLTWGQAFGAAFVGHVLAAALVVGASYPGLYYNISFPVATRVAWGYFGSIFVVLNRILLSIIWFGVQSWQGGLMTYVCLRAMWPSIDHIHNTIPASTGMTLPQFVGFIVFYVVQFPLLFLSARNLRYLTYLGSAAGLIVEFVLTVWACSTMGSAGFGTVLSGKSMLSSGTVGWMFVYAITATMSSITSGTLSVCDYARFAKRPQSGTWSQLFGWFPCWISNVFGILTIAATQNRYGAQLWSVASLLIAMQDADPTSGTRAAVWFCGCAFILSQMSLNILGNSFSGGTDLTSLVPKYINIRRGQIITALLGLVIQPWYLLSGAVVFISVMSAYTVFLQPFLGILLAHYFIIQSRRLKVSDLFILGDKSIYWYTYGVNWRSIVAWVVAVTPHLPGFLNVVVPTLKVTLGASRLYYLSSITTFLISFALSIILAYVFPVQAQKGFVASVSKAEARALCEEYIRDLEISHISHVIDGLNMREWPMEENEKKSMTQENSLQ